MLGRLFGKNKDSSSEAVCAECGRTLLAGEWTQKALDEDGNERLLCSLCGQAHPPAGGERLKVGNGGANATRLPSQDADPADAETGLDGTTGRGETGRGETGRGENAALWKAIKDRDAQIERLQEQLAHGEAERQELLGSLVRLQAKADSAFGAATDEALAVTDAAAIASEPPAEPKVAGEPQYALEIVSEAPADAEAVVEPDEGDVHLSAGDTAEIAAADMPAEEPATVDVATEAVTSPADIAEAEAQAAATTLLQRGVDLLNVSPVPRRIAETNADLGIPTVHVGFDGETAAVTFMWSMGWYRFTVDSESGSVRLGDRGYEELDDLQPNASVRADGTVQLAPARISRAASPRQQAEPDGGAAPVAAEPAEAEEPAEEPAEPSAPPAGSPEILSKSLLGQRTDDERPSWEGTQARDFDWDR